MDRHTLCLARREYVSVTLLLHFRHSQARDFVRGKLFPEHLVAVACRSRHTCSIRQWEASPHRPVVQLMSIDSFFIPRNLLRVAIQHAVCPFRLTRAATTLGGALSRHLADSIHLCCQLIRLLVYYFCCRHADWRL